MDAPAEPAPVTLRQQIQALPPHLLAAWRARFVTTDEIAADARAILGEKVAGCAVRPGLMRAG